MSSAYQKLLDDDLRQVFDFIPRQVLGTSTSLVNRRFNKLAQSKMHIREKHFVPKLILMGRQLRGEEGWRECCLAIGHMLKYEPFFLPISPTVPENILGLQEVVVSHFSGPQLAPFLNETIGHFLTGCTLEIRFVESLLICGDTERAEFDEFIRQFYVRCKVISFFSYERQCQVPAFLLQPQIVTKLKLFQINSSLPREHLNFFVDWLHMPFLNGVVVEEKKLQFKTADRELLGQLVGTIRQRFSTPCQCQPVPFRVLFVYTGQEASHQFEPDWNFLDRNESSGEILSLKSLYYPKMFELRRWQHMPGQKEEECIGQIRQNERSDHDHDGCNCNLLISIFTPAAEP